MPSGEGAVPYQRPRPQLSITSGHSQPAALGGDSVAGQSTVSTAGAALTRSVQDRVRTREGAGDPVEVEGQRHKRTRMAAAAAAVPVQPSQFRAHQLRLTDRRLNLLRLTDSPHAVTADALRALLSVLAGDATTDSLQAVRSLDSYVIPGTHHS